MRLAFWFLISWIDIFIHFYICMWLIIIILIIIITVILIDSDFKFFTFTWGFGGYAYMQCFDNIYYYYFFNKGRWGCGIQAIIKLGLEQDFLGDGYHFFNGRRKIFWGVHGCISRTKREDCDWILFFRNDIHAWGSFKERRLSLGVHELPLTIGGLGRHLWKFKMGVDS